MRFVVFSRLWRICTFPSVMVSCDIGLPAWDFSLPEFSVPWVRISPNSIPRGYAVRAKASAITSAGASVHFSQCWSEFSRRGWGWDKPSAHSLRRLISLMIFAIVLLPETKGKELKVYE